MYGLKRVSQRRDDALSRVGWEQLETLLATYYRGRGYQVDHVGTGASGTRFDGGIDLKLRRENEYVLVQCKHWNAMKVTHNAVHELLGIMVNEGATGAILVTSGEFSEAAIEAGTRQGHVQLIDGEELRAMIGPVPEPVALGSNHATGSDYVAGANAIVGRAGERLLAAAEDRIRHGRRPRARSSSSVALWLIVLKLGFALAMFLVFSAMLRSALSPLTHPKPVQPDKAQILPSPMPPPQGYVSQAAGSDVIVPGESVGRPVIHRPTKAEIREQQRKADEAIEILKKSTPEM
jgi:hypothetical protein